MGIYDVPADMLLEEVARDLKAKVKQPAFAPYVKTGTHRERAPNNPDWYYQRTASILYRMYKEGALGTGALRSYYGGRKNRGVRPEHKYKASGKIIRSALQALEKEGLVKKGKKGRTITPKGEKLLYEKAKAVEVVFKEKRQKEGVELAERLAKAEEARQKAREAKAAQELAKKQAIEQPKKAEQKPSQDATEQKTTKQEQGKPIEPKKPSEHGQAKSGEQKRHAEKTEQKKEGGHKAKHAEPAKQEKKDFAPAG